MPDAAKELRHVLRRQVDKVLPGEGDGGEGVVHEVVGAGLPGVAAVGALGDADGVLLRDCRWEGRDERGGGRKEEVVLLEPDSAAAGARAGSGRRWGAGAHDEGAEEADGVLGRDGAGH